jgi:hypothetical protein
MTHVDDDSKVTLYLSARQSGKMKSIIELNTAITKREYIEKHVCSTCLYRIEYPICKHDLYLWSNEVDIPSCLNKDANNKIPLDIINNANDNLISSFKSRHLAYISIPDYDVNKRI